MLVGGNYRFRSGVDQRAGLKRFMSWNPPAGFAFQGHWARADGNGGMFVAEAESSAAVLEAAGAFADLIDFTRLSSQLSAKDLVRILNGLFF